jgi:hypothetical protein
MAKPFYKSSGILGSLTNALSTVVFLTTSVAGDDLLPEQARGGIQGAAALAMAGGVITALRGRWTATERLTMPWDRDEPLDVTSEMADALLAAVRQTSKSGELPGLDDVFQYGLSRIQAGPAPVEIDARESEPDVPPALLAEATFSGPTSAVTPEETVLLQVGVEGDWEFVAQNDTKLKKTTETRDDNLVILKGTSVWAKTFRFDDDGKHLELKMADDDETRFVFNPDFMVRKNGGPYLLVVEPPRVQPWI